MRKSNSQRDFRRNNEFDKAAGIYEQILAEDPDDAEAYWSRVLCRYGIEYVEDPSTYKRVPTVNRAQYTSAFDDEDYKAALAKGDGAQQVLYKAEAEEINRIQKGILEISSKEDPFDVFICYEETDASGRRTRDSVLANDLYHQLTQEGFKVFFARITLEDKLGSAYEPYIFAALNSAKVMVVLGTRPEHFQAVWVRNEWSRFLGLIKGGAEKTLIPAYRDMDPYDLPEEFSHLQAQDMSKLGFMQDLVRGIRKIAAPEQAAAQTVVVQRGGGDAAALLKRAFMFLEDGEWDQASEYCERVLDIDPECAEAYLGKLMVDVRVPLRAALEMAAEPFGANDNYVKARRFGDQQLKDELYSANECIKERNEQVRLDALYVEAEALMILADTESSYLEAAEAFGAISQHKDAAEKKTDCQKRAEECAEAARIAAYSEAATQVTEDTISSLELAVRGFEELATYKDAKMRAEAARRRLAELSKDADSKRIRALQIIITGVFTCIAACLLFVFVVIPMQERAEFESLKVLSGGLAEAHEGDKVYMGACEQDGLEENGPEDIEWRVLAVEDGRFLLISDKALDCKPFNVDHEKGNKWKTSSLKK